MSVVGCLIYSGLTSQEQARCVSRSGERITTDTLFTMDMVRRKALVRRRFTFNLLGKMYVLTPL